MLSLLIINDITTTFPRPPAYEYIAQQEPQRDYSYDSKNAEIQKKKYDLGPFPVPRSKEATFALVDMIAKSKSRWDVVHSDTQRRRLEAVVTTPILKFKDDVVIEVRDSAEGSLSSGSEFELKDTAGVSWVHMRSKSRTGKSDLGANAARIKSFFQEIKNSLQGN